MVSREAALLGAGSGESTGDRGLPTFPLVRQLIVLHHIVTTTGQVSGIALM